jgi:hypothetical protein
MNKKDSAEANTYLNAKLVSVLKQAKMPRLLFM